MLIPSKKSFRWTYIAVGIFLLNILSLLISRVILNLSINFQNTIGFVILSLIVTALASIGYFGFRKFSYAIIVSDIIGIAYLYYIILSSRSDGWADLTSVFGFIVVIGFGIIAGLFIELMYLLSKRK